MIDTTWATETASAFSQFPRLATGADNTAEGLYSVLALRDRPAGWVVECIGRIERLRELKQNWDSYGAKPVDVDSIASAARLVPWLAGITGIDCPRVTASPAGHVALSWEWKQHQRELDLEILPDGTLRYAFLDEQTPADDFECETTDAREIARLLTKP
jgi:hypothetical protein